jgi:hypothetical protein
MRRGDAGFRNARVSCFSTPTIRKAPERAFTGGAVSCGRLRAPMTCPTTLGVASPGADLGLEELKVGADHDGCCTSGADEPMS